MTDMHSLMEGRAKNLATPPLLDMQHHALFLDIDGTLLDIKPRPELVLADQTLRRQISTLGRRVGGALAFITGRTISDTDRIFGYQVECVAGVHGHERRLGRKLTCEIGKSASIMEVAERFRRLVSARILDVLVEEKGGSVALHYRHAPGQEMLVRRIAEGIADAQGLKAMHGKMVVEIMSIGCTKGSALIDLMRQPPFAGRQPVAVGDDISDEDAFAAARVLGGFGVLVGEPRESVANFRLPSVLAVRAWLEASMVGASV